MHWRVGPCSVINASIPVQIMRLATREFENGHSGGQPSKRPHISISSPCEIGHSCGVKVDSITLPQCADCRS